MLALLLLPPLGLAQWDAFLAGAFPSLSGALAFFVPFFLALTSGGFFFWRGRAHKRPLGLSEGALFAVLVWPYLALVGLLPFWLWGVLGPLDAFFEAMSAVSAVGLSAFPSLAALPPALALWRTLLAWLGGLAFVVLLVTVLPQVSGCFGITLTARQSVYFSPVWRKMNQSVWQGTAVYGAVTALAFFVLLLSGLDPFRALLVALSTVSTAGSGAMAEAYHAAGGLVPLAGCFLMLVAGGNFLLYFKAFSRRSLRLLWADTELRAALAVVLIAGAAVSLHLVASGTRTTWAALPEGFFHVISFFTTAGFAAGDIAAWPDFDRSVLFLLACTGACIGSPAGGLKTLRLLLLLKMTLGELKRTLHPRMVLGVRLDGLAVPEKVVGRILTFFFLYLSVLFVGALALAAAGVAILPSFGLAAGCLTSAGSLAPLLGLPPVTALSGTVKAIACVLMLFGRTVVFALFMLASLAVAHLRKS